MMVYFTSSLSRTSKEHFLDGHADAKAVTQISNVVLRSFNTIFYDNLGA